MLDLEPGVMVPALALGNCLVGLVLKGAAAVGQEEADWLGDL